LSLWAPLEQGFSTTTPKENTVYAARALLGGVRYVVHRVE